LLAAVLPLSWRGFVVSIGCYAIVTAMVITALSRHAPHNDFGAANSVTLTRAALTALLWGASAELAFGNILSLDEQALWVLVLVATAALLSDGVDGWAARRSGDTSRSVRPATSRSPIRPSRSRLPTAATSACFALPCRGGACQRALRILRGLRCRGRQMAARCRERSQAMPSFAWPHPRWRQVAARMWSS